MMERATIQKATTASTNPADVDDDDPTLQQKNIERRSKKVSFKDPAVIPTTKPKAKIGEDNCEHFAARRCSSTNTRPISTATNCNARKPMVRKTCRLKSANEADPKDMNHVPPKKDVVVVANSSVQDVERATNVYARPELNTALRLAERIQALETEDFDGRAAVVARLTDSLSTRLQVEKASLRPLNVGRDEEIYDGVVHLSFDEDALLRAAAEEREAKAKAVLPALRPRDPEPRLDDFRADDAVQPEFARFPEYRLDDLDFGQLTTAPRSATYTLYRHQRMWRGRFSP